MARPAHSPAAAPVTSRGGCAGSTGTGEQAQYTDPTAHWRSALLLIGWLAAAGGACNALSGVDDIEFGASPCTGDLGCSDADPCTTETCGPDGVCAVTPVADGPAPQQVRGDCRTASCFAGAAVFEDDPSDEDDDNPCTIDACTQAGASHQPVEDGDECQMGTAQGVCAQGSCIIDCTASADCDDGQPCTIDSCDLQLDSCVFEANHGALVDPTSATDCVQIVCNGSTPVSTADDGEVPDDDNGCTEDACSAGAATHTPQPGRRCAGGACNDRGQCVGCKTATECEGVDDACAQRTCIEGVCGMAYSPAGTATSPQVVGDCSEAVCDGSGGVTQVAHETDVPPRDGNSCTTSMCVGTLAMQTPVAAGQPCQNGYCNGEGGCSDCITDDQCPAALVCSSFMCKKPIGQSCASGAECATTYCVDGYCCNEPCTGLCQACAGAKSIGQSGVCAPIETGSDPDNECVAPAATTCCNSSTCGFC
jgi:hypothetical protein